MILDSFQGLLIFAGRPRLLMSLSRLHQSRPAFQCQILGETELHLNGERSEIFGKWLVMVMYASNPSNQKVEAGGLGVESQSGLCFKKLLVFCKGPEYPRHRHCPTKSSQSPKAGPCSSGFEGCQPQSTGSQPSQCCDPLITASHTVQLRHCYFISVICYS